MSRVADPVILSCGEALIDFLPHRMGAVAAYRPAPGGSLYNVAVGLGRLGVPAGFLGGLSSDFFGDMLLQGLAASGVSDAYVARLERPSTLAFVSLDTDEPHYAFYDEGAADRSWTGAADVALAPTVRALHFGSLALLREPAASAYESLLLRERARGRLLSLDPNIRAAMVRDEPAYRARLDRAIAAADVVKVSAIDLDWLAPGADAARVAAGWLERGPSLVVLTRGGRGPVAYRAGGTIEERAAPAQVVDTVGAGDSFMAGLLAFLAGAACLAPDALRALPAEGLREGLRYASRVAAFTCGRAGADPPWRHELDGETPLAAP